MPQKYPDYKYPQISWNCVKGNESSCTTNVIKTCIDWYPNLICPLGRRTKPLILAPIEKLPFQIGNETLLLPISIINRLNHDK